MSSKRAPAPDAPTMRSDDFDEVIRRAFRAKMPPKPVKKTKRPKAKKKTAR